MRALGLEQGHRMVSGLQMLLYLLLTAAICLVLVLHTKKALRLVARRPQPSVMDQGLALCILTSGSPIHGRNNADKVSAKLLPYK
jgi:hypothetical protein